VPERGGIWLLVDRTRTVANLIADKCLFRRTVYETPGRPSIESRAESGEGRPTITHVRRNYATAIPAGLEVGDHVAWIGDGQGALNRLATEVIREATRHEDLTLFVSSDADPARLVDVPDLDRLLADGEVGLARIGDMYPGGLDFDPSDQLAIFADVLADALAAGYRGIRVVADNTSLAQGDDDAWQRWLRWEQITDRFQSTNPVLGLCYFDRGEVTATRLADLQHAHPVNGAAPAGDIDAAEPGFQLFFDRGDLRLVGQVEYSSMAALRRLLAAVPAGAGYVIDVDGADWLDHRTLHALYELSEERQFYLVVRNASPLIVRIWTLLALKSDRVIFA
jgi:hypothetical protein